MTGDSFTVWSKLLTEIKSLLPSHGEVGYGSTMSLEDCIQKGCLPSP